MNILTIIKGVIAVLTGVITTVIPCGIALAKTIKAKKEAKTEAEKEAAKTEMLNAVNGFISSAEELYKNIELIVKQNGGSCGAIKKENVLTKLQAFAIEKGYAFDAAFWSTKIDEIVAMTKAVNAKK